MHNEYHTLLLNTNLDKRIVTNIILDKHLLVVSILNRNTGIKQDR